MSPRDIAILIPAYRPSTTLVGLVKALVPEDWPAVAVVDDGSGPEYRAVFDEVAQLAKVEVLRHAVNLGKGAALKTGINAILCDHPDVSGVLTVDADGQHDPADVRKVCARFQESPDSLVMGVRAFRAEAPLRSRFGNRITRMMMRAVAGQNLSDTQTGLRAIPRALLPGLLKVPASGYEFELEMLLAVKHLGVQVVEQPIRTIYEAGNRSSHFHPLRDSMRIYFVLLRFTGIGALTAILDNLTFYLVFQMTASILTAQIGARLAAVAFNYTTVRRAVFLSDERHRVLLPRYLLVVAANAALSYAGIRVLNGVFHVPVLAAKIAAETFLFIASFLIQRDFVFTKRAAEATDWDRYYRSVPFTANLTRRYTQSVLISLLRKFSGKGSAALVEIGGANSCFLDGILNEIRPAAYHVIDRNEYGLSLLRTRLNGRPDVFLHQADVLRFADPGWRGRIVFSVGLIEHFDRAGTRRAIRAHFDLLDSGGYVIVTFPTPTWLYVGARSITEALGMWHFPDERPLKPGEVQEAVRDLGEVVFEKTLWPLVFTQHLMVVRKTAGQTLGSG
jgi:putative flippase GtrA